MTPKGLHLLLGAVFVALVETSWGQKASNWRVYAVADGLPESACASVLIGPDGKVLASHLNVASASELDGYATTSFPLPASGRSRVYESPAGRLWTVTPEGLQEFNGGAWVLHPIPEIAAEFRASVPHFMDPVPLCPVRQGLVIFLLPDQLVEFNFENPDQPRTRVLLRVGQTRLEKFSGMTSARDGGLWIAGARGLAKSPGPAQGLQPESQWREYVPPEALQIQNLENPHEDEEGGITAVAESLGSRQNVAVHFDGQKWTLEAAGIGNIRHAWHGPDKTFWASTPNSLFQREEGQPEMAENEEIYARRYSDVAVEPGGTFWLATSEGLFHYVLPIWRSPAAVGQISSLVHCLTEDSEGRLWFASGTGLHVLQNDVHREYPFPATAARASQAARALFPLKDGTLLLDMGDQLYQFHPGSGTFSAVPIRDNVRHLKPLGLLKDGSLCLRSSNPDSAEGEYRLDVFDGTEFRPFPYPPPDSALGGNLATLFAAQNGDLWLSGDNGTAWYHDKKWQTFVGTGEPTPAAAPRFAELPDGKIWCATQSEIWEFDGRKWSAVRIGLDHVNDLLRARDGSVWVAANNGLHRFFTGAGVEKGAWVENGVEEGLPGASVRGIYEDRRGRIWAGTTRGLGLYHPEADSDPPRTQIQKLNESEKKIPEGGTITLTFTGTDKWKHTPRERLLYSCRLDDRDWSPFHEANNVTFDDLPAGKHYFQVRAMDRNCNVDPNPARLEFAVALPWFKEPRLVLTSFAGLAIALFFAGLAFNRHRQLLRSYAEVEEKIAERTRELEIADRALLQSQKMNALGTLAAGIAHDFNNILSIIKGSAQIIEDNLDNPQKVCTRVDRIKTVVEQGAGIVKAMLGFSRSSDEEAGLCDLNAVVDDTIKLLGDRFVRDVEISFQRAPNLPQVPASRDFIQQILLNFILNAAESMTAMPNRKQIILATRQLDGPPADLVLAPARAAAYVSISVRDFGCGIPSETMPRIFEPFFTTKALSARRGTGLGLTMVYELAKKMEAGLAVESVVDQGSTFTLILPVRDLPAGA